MISPDIAHKMLEALQAAIACGMVPTTSASEGGAAKFSEQVRVADLIRDVVAQATASPSAPAPAPRVAHEALREHAILAWRALNACAEFLSTFSPEGDEEVAGLKALQAQVNAAALGLFMDSWPGRYPDLGEPQHGILPRESIAHVPTMQDLTMAAQKLSAMGSRLGQDVRIVITPRKGPAA